MGCTSTTAYLTIHNMVSWMLGSWLPAEVAEEGYPGSPAASCWDPTASPSRGGPDAAASRPAPCAMAKITSSTGKVFISGAGCTDVLVVMARTGGEGAKGISAFMVPAQTPA